jgi:hypothetical protein
VSTSRDESGAAQFAHLDASWMVPADLCAVDAIARLQLVALRYGRSLEIHGADGELAALLEFAGLDAVIHLCPRCQTESLGSAGDGLGESEGLEQRRIQE